jgi:YD repeat-containing protein
MESGSFIKSSYYANHIPKNPQTASLGTFGNTPVNYYTGLPEISIELMRLKGRQLELPVTLNYDASGVRTDEFASAVGLKWTLSAGGFVARSLYGLPDEHPTSGYLKYAAETNYFQTVDTEEDYSDWVRAIEEKRNDTEPDEFIINVPGRSIKFYLDKNGEAVVVPRQKVKINKVVTSGKITKFELITEDGTKYTFGEISAAIEERKIETISTTFRINYEKALEACEGTAFGTTFWGKNKVIEYNTDIETKERTIDFYNAKWHLISIASIEGETITFDYTKLGNTIYATRPTSIRVMPMLSISDVSYNVRCNALDGSAAWWFVNGWVATRPGSNEIPGVYQGPVPALAKYNQNPRPGTHSLPQVPWDPPISEYIGVFNPAEYGAKPGGSMVSHSIVTESVIRLNSIKATATGHTIDFTSSSRTDMPNAIKYDKITLNNVSAVKSIKLNFQTVRASELNDYFWLPEAWTMMRINTLKTQHQGLTNFYAFHLRDYNEGDISIFTSHPLHRFAFENVKDYNYQRLFLESIDDVTAINNGGNVQTLYEFSYNNRDQLRRRTTVLHDSYGFTRNEGAAMSWGFKGDKIARIGQGFKIDYSSNRIPLTGLLTTIKYPTGGSTQFTYSVPKGIKVASIQDKDQKGNTLYERSFEYNELGNIAVGNHPIHESYDDFLVRKENAWMKYESISSSPQNDSYSLSHGAVQGSLSTTVYYGTKTDNNGFEEYSFYSDADVRQAVSSVPRVDDVNLDGTTMSLIFPFPRNHERDFIRGLVRTHKIYRRNGTTPIKEIQNNYVLNPNGFKPESVIGMKGGSFTWSSNETFDSWRGVEEVNAEVRFRYSKYSLTSDWLVLDNTVETIHDQADLTKSVSKTTKYTYDPVFLQKKEERTYQGTATDNALVTKTKYVTDLSYTYPKTCSTTFSTCYTNCNGDATCMKGCEKAYITCLSSAATGETAAIIQLQLNNQYGIPVESQTWLEKPGQITLTKAVVNTYQKLGSAGVVKPKEVWTLDKPLTSFTGSYVDNTGIFKFTETTLDNTLMRKVHRFDTYDATTYNLLNQTTLDGTISAYGWGYGGSLVNSHTVNPGTTELKTTYSHNPYRGLESITDPNGLSTSFNYDDWGRLLHVKDNDLKVKSRYRYHYAGQKEALITTFNQTGGNPLAGSKMFFSIVSPSERLGKTTYTWNFGDGNPSVTTTTTIVEYTYTSAGTYTVTLTESNSEYGSASASMTVNIYTPVTIGSICVDGPVVVEACGTTPPVRGNCTSVGPINNNSPTTLKITGSGGCSSLTYRWEVQNAGVWSTFGTSTSTTSPPSGFVNRTAGSYKVRCIVSDSCGFSKTSAEITLTIYKSNC